MHLTRWILPFGIMPQEGLGLRHEERVSRWLSPEVLLQEPSFRVLYSSWVIVEFFAPANSTLQASVQASTDFIAPQTFTP
ncbi:hypothetical protein NLI96_g2483 [Meripilus lineatus]|uniref:Uncharacterized protein n=1 Tax=Meripilus lineatus TaxID=2056292 RepID=A0AAD5V899_9APHY|nr:hypothetical protein NLI96_g2483 [Physisporinus lineatus]